MSSVNHKAHHGFLQTLIESGISSVISKIVVAPIERVKLILQTQQILQMQHISGEKYLGMFDCFQRLIREEGPASLWRGNTINIIRYAPTQAFNFAFNGLLQRELCIYDSKTEYRKYLASYFVSGGLAGIASMIIFYPLDFLRTRVATDMGKHNHEREFTGMVDCTRKIYQRGGISAFFSGMSISFGVVFFYRGVYFGGAELGKREIKLVRENRIVKFLYYQLVAAVAGLSIHPLDTIRRRLMVQSGRLSGIKEYASNIDCVRKMYQTENIHGFYKGGLTNVYRGMGSAIVMMIFDEFAQLPAVAKKE